MGGRWRQMTVERKPRHLRVGGALVRCPPIEIFRQGLLQMLDHLLQRFAKPLRRAFGRMTIG